MQYGVGHLNIVPVRLENSDKSEMVTQLLFGDHFKIIDKRKNWVKIRIAFDQYEGWIDHQQYIEITEENYKQLDQQKNVLVGDLVEFLHDQNHQLQLVSIGANLKALSLLPFQYDGKKMEEKLPKSELVKTALLYLNSPYLWGGKTPFGIDCSGFTQMVYKICGYALKRDASQQATQGEALSFIEESEPGDLAFFDNAEGNIIHVGIIMENNYIIHAHGKVRVDRIDHSGIFNVDTSRYSHNLRVIKKIV
ncbi:C40 family peptidase [Mesonia sp. K7]|uniref:C40 family peptidase n=1 Tax=Mesonia sp. K7 TaxID=2218606 RepID=UPI000DA75CDD|nr:C40 family peptidase [Mesonia sp. K7]PZD79328.1 hydrolase Nlp/P60 [Mesonia sp. K7]